MTSSSQYLTSKTDALTSTTPVAPAQAQAAQIPLQSFNLPTFPPEAFAAGLGALILTSDIKLDEYTEVLQKPFSVPELPSSITSLTLELFSLGYPPGFLAALGKRLPNLKAITIYSQLFAGTTAATRDDALAFLRFQPAIQELHLLDVFGPAEFFTALSKVLSSTLRFVEINYTYRHSDPAFLATIPSRNLPALLSKDLVALTMSISAPDITEDEDDKEGTEVGMKPVGGRDAREVVEKLVEDGENLVLLDATMFEFSPAEVEKIVTGLGKVKVLNITVGLERGWDEIFDALGKEEGGLEVLEIVGVPGEGMVERLKQEGEEGVEVTKEMLEKLGGKCKALNSVKTSILRTGVSHWVKNDIWEKSA